MSVRRPTTLRRRIATGAAGLSAAVAIGAGGVVFALERTLVRAISVRGLEQDLARVANAAVDDPVAAVARDDLAEAYAFFPAAGGEAVSSGWRRLGLGTGLAIEDVEAAARGLERRMDDRVLRLLVGPAPHGRGLLAVARDESKAAAAITLLGFVMIGAAPLVAAVCLMGGNVVATRILRPVEALEGEIAAVGADRIDRRIEVGDAPAEFAAVVRQLNGMLDRIERAYEAQRQFAAQASHELRTPLSAMRSVGETALLGSGRDAPGAETTVMRDAVVSMLEEADRLARMTDQLLALARTSSGIVRTRPVRLASIVSAVVARLEPLIEDAGAIVRTETLDPGVLVQGDETLLDRMITALVDNALRHGGPGTTIRISASAAASWVDVVVADDGPGVEAESRTRIFEPFARGRTVFADAAREGSGLGLALVRAAVRAMGGEVEAGEAGPEVGGGSAGASGRTAGRASSPPPGRGPGLAVRIRLRAVDEASAVGMAPTARAS